jgi:hypothetical protein
MQVGSVIKSFDFPGNFTCYMLGKVIAVDGDMITCETIKQVFDGKNLPIEEFNKTFRTVAQGRSFMDDMFQFERVVVIG